MTDQNDTQHPSQGLQVRRNFDDFFSQTLAYAQSGYFKDARTHSQAVVKVLAGQELGVSPMTAMTGIYIVKDKVQVGASILAALLRKSSEYDYRLEDLTDDRCEIVFTRDGEDLSPPIVFAIEDATRAGLAGKDNYKHHPRNMLFARAISDGVKFHAPDLLLGLPVYTEGDDLGEPEAPKTSRPVADFESNAVEIEQEDTQAAVVLITEEQAEQIDRLLEQNSIGGDDFEMTMTSLGIVNLSDATREQADKLIDAVQQKVVSNG